MPRNQLTTPGTQEDSVEQRTRSRFRSADLWLWGFVVVALVLDVVLTYYGLAAGLQEGNPLARRLFAMFGVVESMLFLKGAVIAIALVAYAWLPEQYQPVVPLGIALPWFVAGLINASLILQL